MPVDLEAWSDAQETVWIDRQIMAHPVMCRDPAMPMVRSLGTCCPSARATALPVTYVMVALVRTATPARAKAYCLYWGSVFFVGAMLKRKAPDAWKAQPIPGWV